MRIEFGKIINDRETREKCILWYKENLKTLHGIFGSHSVPYKAVYCSEFERIYLVNDETFVYMGIVSEYFDSGEYDIGSKRGYGVIGGYIKHGSCIDVSKVFICELNYSSFKGIQRSVFEEASSKTSDPWIGNPDIIHNYPYLGSYAWDNYEKCFEHCCKLLPNYDLNKIINEFEGAPFCVVVYKIEGKNGEKGYATYSIEDSKMEKAHDLAKKCIKNYLVYCLDFSKRPVTPACPSNLLIDDEFKRIYRDRLFIDGNQIADEKEVFKYISYCLINVNDNPKPNEKELYDYYVNHVGEPVVANFGSAYLCNKVLNDALAKAFLNNDYFYYADGKIKWKSEYLVYQIVKTLYPLQTIYQYRPFFLKSEKGQLSYDIFITGLNVAIEYQGKQHFSPVDFFGGEEAYKDNQRRDALKSELSKRNNIKLIYIDYTETISEELIKSKIAKAVSE